MDAVQFSLFFVALLVGYVLVHLRLVRFEDHLAKLAGIRGLDDRLRALDDRLRMLGESFDKLRLDRVENQLGRLHDDLEDLRDATSLVRQAVVEIPAPVVPAVPAAAPAAAPIVYERAAAPSESPAARLATMVETRLLQLGYREVQILTDLSTVPADAELELQVECTRGNMPAKGRVLIRNGSVRDLAMQTVAPMFP
jgi:hypothetical protein